MFREKLAAYLDRLGNRHSKDRSFDFLGTTSETLTIFLFFGVLGEATIA